MITDERLREIEWATTYVTTHAAPRGCRCAGSCSTCREWKRQAAVLAPSAVLELVSEVRRARAALTWIEQNVSQAELADDYLNERRGGVALVALALSEAT